MSGTVFTCQARDGLIAVIYEGHLTNYETQQERRLLVGAKWVVIIIDPRKKKIQGRC